ncbi:MAG: hypothetical protein Q4B71_05320 [Cardiobacteriaceae bacterium]|nr:hypothetical protein [Cardiobacteriaceae bacterium]
MKWQAVESLPHLGDAVVAYDSEFMRNQTYYPDLLLVQIHQLSWEQVALFDVWTYAPTPEHWQQWLSIPRLFLMHAGYSDLTLMAKASGGLLPKRYLDSQIGFALCQRESYNPSYAMMVKALFGIELDKSPKRSDWYQRPLSQQQQDYAALDVWYLSQAYELLCERLSALGRLSWWEEESKRLLLRASEYEESALNHWYHLSGSPALNTLPRARFVAEILMQTRERLAKQHNKARHLVVSDEYLLKAALAQPRDFVELMEYLPEDSLIWEAMDDLQQAFSRSPKPMPSHSLPPPKPIDKTYFQHLRERIDAIADDLQLHPQTLVSTSALKQWCQNPETASLRLDDGFRKALFHEVL